MREDRASVLFAFARWLGQTLDLPDIPPRVVERAASDPLFLNRLIMVRDDPVATQALMATASGSLPKWTAPATVLALKHLTLGMTRWAATGFQPVDAATLDTRVAACRHCPHLSEPGQMLQKLVAGSEGKICGLCSCAIEKKAMLPTETCPAVDPEQPGYTRWGEPHIF